MSYDISLSELPKTPTLSIREKVPFPQLPEKVGSFVGQAVAHAQAHDQQQDGAPFTRVHGFANGAVDLEAGIALAEPLPAQPPLASGYLPGGAVATTVHAGNYTTLPAAGEALRAWAAQEGYRPTGPSWDRHLVAPGHDPNPENWRTQVCLPLQKMA